MQAQTEDRSGASRTKRSYRTAAAGLAGIALVAAACGSSGTKATSSATTALPTSATAPTPTGPAVQLGLINQGKGAVAFPEVADPIVAAIKWVNAHGGVGGSPINLNVCLDDGTAGGSAACATQLVGDKVVAVLDGEDLTNASTHSILDAAHIPMIGWNPFTAADFASTNSWWFSPGFDLFASIVKAMHDQFHATTAGYLQPNLAAAAGPLKIMEQVGDKIGLKINAVAYDYSSQSFAGPVAQLVAGHPDVIFTYAADKTASPIIQAIRQAGFTGTIFPGTTRTFVDVLGAANSKDVDVQATLYDWHIPQSAPAADRPEIATYLAAMQAYDSGNPETAYGQWAFSEAMNVVNLIKEIGPATTTASSIVAALKMDKDRHNYMGATYNCVTNPLPTTPGTCVRGAQLVSFDGTKWQESGNFITAADLIGG